ncbi:MAG: hypothetical protein M0R39_10510 [Prolixibacteraceae bacterium]|nr:hypothetical protein [Prolixibacteraceae bacterium]
MRTFVRLITVTMLLLCIQKNGVAQSLDDQSKVLQKCFDLTELQQYFPLDNVGNPNQVYVMQYAVTFPTGLNVLKAGKPVLFVSREEIIQNKIKSYFIFRSFDLTASEAKASFNFFYSFDYATNQFKMVMVNIELNKINQDWSVTNIKLEGDTI